jgi:hypothetical protein
MPQLLGPLLLLLLPLLLALPPLPLLLLMRQSELHLATV